MIGVLNRNYKKTHEVPTVKFLYTHCKETLHFYKIENHILLIHIVLRFWHEDCFYFFIYKFVSSN